MRAVLDTNVLIAAILSPRGSSADLVRAWQAGDFDLVASPGLLAELREALRFPVLQRLVTTEDADAYVEMIGRAAVIVEDPAGPPAARTDDPADNHRLALAAAHRALLVTGDEDLASLSELVPVLEPAAFLASLRDSRV